MRLFGPLLLGSLLVACAPARAETTSSIKVIAKEPRCEKIGLIEGVGGNDGAARASALEQAAERGATHIMLEPAHPDLEDGMTTIVTARIYRCPSPGEQYPPVGYE